MATAERNGTWTAAIAHDGQGRHYFLSLDGLWFRTVPYFPVGSSEAEGLLQVRTGRERHRIELERDFAGRLAFMPVTE
jgi:hypothetical protein